MYFIGKESKEERFPGPPQYIIFDMDGVIFDTPKIYFEVHQEMAQAINGYSFTIDDQRELLLKKEESKLSSLEIFLQIIGLSTSRLTDNDLEELETLRFSLVRTKIKARNLVRPGASELINWLIEEGRVVCLATKSRSDFVNFFFDNNQGVSLNQFHFIVTRSDLESYKRTKTDINRLMLKRIESLVGKKIERNQCLMFEDSPYGVLAAKEAGIGTVIAVPDGVSWDFEEACQVFTSADFIVPDLASVLSRWQRLNIG